MLDINVNGHLIVANYRDYLQHILITSLVVGDNVVITPEPHIGVLSCRSKPSMACFCSRPLQPETVAGFEQCFNSRANRIHRD